MTYLEHSKNKISVKISTNIFYLMLSDIVLTVEMLSAIVSTFVMLSAIALTVVMP